MYNSVFTFFGDHHLLVILYIECVIGFNVVYQQFIAMYDSSCQICCNWFRFKSGFTVPEHRSTMPQINMIPHPVTLN